MATLNGISEDVKGRHIELDIDEVSIGRIAENTVVVDNPTVSSRHCVIVKEDAAFVLKDLGSTNGTRLNSRDITEVTLSPKDVVQVGSVEFIFDDESAPAPTRRPSVVTTKVTEDYGTGVRPESFDSISPFGSQKKDSRGLWVVVIALLGVLAVLAVAFFVIKLINLT